MAVRLVIEVIGNDPEGAEVVAAHVKSGRFDPAHLDALIRNCVMQLLGQQTSTLEPHKMRNLEVAISLSATNGEKLRPGLHLSKETVGALAKAEASLDFDPYV
jgi:hypothetical protein